LCEQKILELAPGHSLPLKAEDLGKENIARNSLNSLKAQMEEVMTENRSLRGSIGGQVLDKLRKEKAALEESLRGEILINEEQRNYIEILREALELKNPKRQNPDNFVSMAMMKRELERKEMEQQKNEEDISEMEGLITYLKRETEEQKVQLESLRCENEKLIKENEELVKEIQEISQKVFC